MKKLILLSAAVFAALSVMAQSADSLALVEQQKIAQHNADVEKRMEYDRSSLAVAMIYHSEDEFGGDIRTAFEGMPFPDKYDNHDVGLKVIDNALIPEVKKNRVGLIKAKYGKKLSANDIAKNAAALEAVLNEAHVANYMIAKWYGLLDGNGVFNTDLIAYRGQYNATELDVALASQSAGNAINKLKNAGRMLIGNTYMLINDMTYVTAEEKAQAAKIGLAIVGGILDGLLGGSVGSDLADAGSKIADSFTGFAVKTHSYLFRLQWSEELEAIFYDEYYMNKPDPVKLNRFLNDNRFSVKFVAHEYETSEKSVPKGTIERSDLVKMVCTRSMDKNIAALQLQYEDFKVKTPIYEVVMNDKGKVKGYGVKIGLKESISEKSTFQVVRKEVDPQTNKTTYRYVASLKPIKGQIWDNRYMAANENAAGSGLQYSTLKKTAGGEILPGMLVIEGKYSKITQ